MSFPWHAAKWASRVVPFGLILLVVGLFFWQSILFDKLPLPADLLQRELPWQLYLRNNSVQNHYLSDNIRVHYPFKRYVSNRLAEGEIPLWIPEVGLGYPLFGNEERDLLGLSGLLLILLRNADTTWTVLLAVQLSLAGFFMYWYMRSIQVGRFGALVSAVSFMLNFLFIDFLLSQQIVGAMLWAPLLLLLLEKYEQRKNSAYLVLAGLVVGLAILNGSLQTALYILLIASIYFAYRAFRSVHRGSRVIGVLTRNGIALMAMIAVGVTVACVKLLPVFEFLTFMVREPFSLHSWLETLWKKPLTLPFFTGFIFPDLIGSHRALDLTKILGDMGGGGNISGELFKAYIGLLPFVFALIAVRFRRCKHTWLFVCMAVIPIFITLFTPLYQVLYFRVFVVYTFAASVLAGLGADWVVGLEGRKSSLHWGANLVRRGLLVIGLLLAIINMVLIAFGSEIAAFGKRYVGTHMDAALGYNYDISWQLGKVDRTLQHYRLINPTMYLPLVIGCISFILLKWFGQKKLGKTLFAGACLSLIFFDLARLGWDYIPFVNKNLIFPQTASVRFLQSDRDLFRVASIWDRSKDPPVFPPNTLLPYYISDIAIYESLVPDQTLNIERFYDLMNVKYVLTAPGKTMPSKKYDLVFDEDIWIYRNKGVLPRAYVIPNAWTVATSEQALAKIKDETFDPQCEVIIEGSDRTGTTWVGNAGKSMIRIINYMPERVEIEAEMDAPGFLVLSDRYYPGWRVFVDDKEDTVLKANYLFRGVRLEEGKHRVVFSFKPRSFKIGMILSLAGISGVFMSSGIWLHRGKKRVVKRKVASEVR